MTDVEYSAMTRRTATSLITAALSTSPAWSARQTEVGGELLVANKGDRSLGIIDPVTNKQVAAVPENGVTGHEVIASPDGSCLRSLYGDSGVGKPGTNGRNIVAIDISSRKIVSSLDFGHGVRPHCPQFGRRTDCCMSRRSWTVLFRSSIPSRLKVVGRSRQRRRNRTCS